MNMPVMIEHLSVNIPRVLKTPTQNSPDIYTVHEIHGNVFSFPLCHMVDARKWSLRTECAWHSSLASLAHENVMKM